jgi:hypothetical protein
MSNNNNNHAIEDALLMNFYISSYQQTEQRIQQLYHTLDVFRENIELLHRSRRSVRSPSTSTRARVPPRNVNEGIPVRTPDVPRPTLSPVTIQFETEWIDRLFEPVAVVPTADQIRNGSRRVRFGDIPEPLNSSCPISLERFEPDSEVMELLACHHLFHPSCLQGWFQNNPRCPVCRHDIRENNNPENANQENNSINNVQNQWIDPLETILRQMLSDIPPRR